MTHSPSALVTGGNRGLGLETCRQLSAAGYNVWCTARDLAKATLAADALNAAGGGRVRPLHLDVTDPASIAAAAATVQATDGHLDALVNNAGIFRAAPSDGASVLDQPISSVQAVIATNVFGPLEVARAFVPLLKANGGGRIVNVSSGMGQLADMGAEYPGYRISKTALNALTGILAAELKGDQILVNSVCPGWVHTDMGGPKAPRTPAQGADTIVWLAMLPPDGPTGGFFRDRQPIPW